jgi:hypothetical protein
MMATLRSRRPWCACCAQGPAFDTDARRAQGPVLRWVDRLLRAPAPPCGASAGLLPAAPKAAVGRAALLNLLRSNLEVFGVCVDRCYDRDPRIGRASFQVWGLCAWVCAAAWRGRVGWVLGRVARWLWSRRCGWAA